MDDSHDPFNALLVGFVEAHQSHPPTWGFDMDSSKAPTYRISEMTKTFFGRSRPWYVKHEGNGDLVVDGTPVDVERERFAPGADSLLMPGIGTARKFDLAVIESIAAALSLNGVITSRRVALVMLGVRLALELNDVPRRSFDQFDDAVRARGLLTADKVQKSAPQGGLR